MSGLKGDPSLVESVDVTLEEDSSSESTSSFDGDTDSVKSATLNSDDEVVAVVGKTRKKSSVRKAKSSKSQKKGAAAATQLKPSGKSAPSSSVGFHLSQIKRPSLDDPTYYAQTPISASPATITVTDATPGPGAAADSTTTYPSTKPTKITYKAPTVAPKTAPRVHTRPAKSRGTDGTRDPENINDVVMVKFEEVFAEPEGTYSFGTVWGASYRVFSDSKLWCYRFLSSACAVPCALCWGINFACLTFCQIWAYQPCFRTFRIQVKPVARIYSVLIKSFIEPCYEAMALILSNIRIHSSTD